jgi:hypothetical protein
MYTIIGNDGNELQSTQTSLTARPAKVFRKQGQGVQDFGAEVRMLTDDDRQWFIVEFNRAGYPTVDRTTT